MRFKIDENLPIEIADILDKPFVLGMVTKLLAALQQQDPTGKLWIVEEKHIRVRE